MSDDKEEDTERVVILHDCPSHRVFGDSEGNVRTVYPVVEGKPIPEDSNIVIFSDVEGQPNQKDMKTIRRTSGPSRTSNKKYRTGWDSVFGKKPDKKDLN